MAFELVRNKGRRLFYQKKWKNTDNKPKFPTVKWNSKNGFNSYLQNKAFKVSLSNEADAHALERNEHNQLTHKLQLFELI